MKLLDGSGGSTKGGAIYNVWKVAKKEKGFNPQIISGVSVSALISVPFALGKFKELDSLFNTFTLDDIFKKSPINKKGGITRKAALRALFGYPSLGTMESLEKLLKKLVTKEDFKYYQLNTSLPACYILAIDFKTTKRVLVNLQKVESYEAFIKYTIASASIPVYSEGVKWDGKVLYDGGVRDHSIGYKICQDFDITECISVWSRPKKPVKNEEQESLLNKDWEDTNVVEVAERALEILQLDNSEQDEDKLEQICKDKNIDIQFIHLPKVLTSLYDTERKRLNKLTEEGIKLARNKLKNGNSIK